MTRKQPSADFQWLEGRRFHNIPGSSYLLPNDIDESTLTSALQLYFCYILHASPESHELNSIHTIGPMKEKREK
ncbi:hypothetical protein BGZ92_007443 [Podila epicladia]|nr:hypothetical protein BGZ92_007443 [Podila epicladia]